MKLVATVFFLISWLGVGQTLAEEGPQPLTRADCEEAGLTWNENSIACGVVFDAPVRAPGFERSQANQHQPLTKEGCEHVGMHWNDSVLVCEENSEEARVPDDTNVASQSTILIHIDKAAQSMVVSVDGEDQHHWRVSTGRPGYSTPSGTFKATSMNEIWYSREWDDAPMPHSIFFTKDGHAIHGTEEVTTLGEPASHGCVRLAPENAATLYELVSDSGLENTQIVLAGLTPGHASHQSRSRPAVKDEPSVQPKRRIIKKRRGGILRRLFGR